MQESKLVDIVTKEIIRHKSESTLLAISGGADSWFLYFLLKKMNISFKTLTLSFEKKNYGEEKVVTKYLSHLGEKTNFQYVSSQQMIEEFYAFSRELKIEIYNLHAISKWILAKRAKELGFKRVITGDGADQWFRKEDCDLFPITQSCFKYFGVEIITPLAIDKTWGLVNGKNLVRGYVSKNLKIFNCEKIVKLYPDDDFLPLNCLQVSRSLVSL